MFPMYLCLKVEAVCVPYTLCYNFYFKHGVRYKFQRGSDSSGDIQLSESCKIVLCFLLSNCLLSYGISAIIKGHYMQVTT